MTGLLAYENHALDQTVTDDGATFDAARPIGNLAIEDVPTPYATFNGATATFSVNWGGAQSVGLFGLMSHDLPDGAVIEWQNLAGPVIATHTVARVPDLPVNALTLLSADSDLSGVRVAVTNAGSGTHRIGTLFAAQVLRVDVKRGWAQGWEPTAQRTRIGSAEPASRGLPYREESVAFAWKGPETAYGVDSAGNAVAGLSWQSVLARIADGRAVLYAARADSQAWLDRTALYGRLARLPSLGHLRGPAHEATFRAGEMR